MCHYLGGRGVKAKSVIYYICGRGKRREGAALPDSEQEHPQLSYKKVSKNNVTWQHGGGAVGEVFLGHTASKVKKMTWATGSGSGQGGHGRPGVCLSVIRAMSGMFYILGYLQTGHSQLPPPVSYAPSVPDKAPPKITGSRNFKAFQGVETEIIFFVHKLECMHNLHHLTLPGFMWKNYPMRKTSTSAKKPY